MNKLKSILAMYALDAIMYDDLSNSINVYKTKKTKETKETKEERNKRLSIAEIKCNKANGLKEFIYGENSLWALNKRNADRKAKAKGWI
jgi:hypothetical protein